MLTNADTSPEIGSSIIGKLGNTARLLWQVRQCGDGSLFRIIPMFHIQPIWAPGVECEIASSSSSMFSSMVSNIGVDR